MNKDLCRSPSHIVMKGLFLLVLCASLLVASELKAVLATGSPTNLPMPGRYLHAEAEFRAMQLRDENGQIPQNALLNAVQQKRQMRVIPGVWPSAAATVTGPQPRVAGISTAGWTWLGPGNIGGRVRSIVVHPTNPNVMWAGGVGGGVWKTYNAGTSWQSLNDFLPTLAVGCMTMDPKEFERELERVLGADLTD